MTVAWPTGSVGQRATPNDADIQRSLGRAYWFAGALDKAEMRFNLAVKLKPTLVDAAQA